MSYDYYRLNTEVTDLHAAVLPTDWPHTATPLRDYGAEVRHGSTVSRVHFHYLAGHLIWYIRQADLVVGCVAWLTHESLLAALSQLSYGTALVVQKEDFLRPDAPSPTGTFRASPWKTRLHDAYGALHHPLGRTCYPEPLGSCSICGDPGIDPVRCMGNHNRDKEPAFPRMHHKFLVFCRVHAQRHFYEDVQPYAVWTGSFNLTQNAERSLENALYLTDPALVQAYYQEWAQIEALSEPLNWEYPWCAPEWRIGT